MSDEKWRAAMRSSAMACISIFRSWWNLDEAVRLARDFPRTLMRSSSGCRRIAARRLGGWHAAMARFAFRANVRVKISGLGQPAAAGRRTTIAWIVEESSRCSAPNARCSRVTFRSTAFAGRSYDFFRLQADCVAIFRGEQQRLSAIRREASTRPRPLHSTVAAQ